MTQPLTIPTPFNDVSELTDNFATRVDETQIMLPYSEPIEDGVWLSFTVLLADGSVALEGTGRSTGAHDNGEEYPPEYRYDVVLDSLQFAGMSEVMFERILQARQSQLEGDPGTGEVDVNQLAAAPEESVEDAPAEVSAPAVEAAPDEAEDELGAAEEPAHEPPADLPTEAVALEPSQPMEAVDALPSEEAQAEESGEEWAPEDGGFAESIPTQAVALEAVAPRAVPSAPPVTAQGGRSAPPAPAPQRAAAAAPARPSPPQRPRGGLPLMHTFDDGVLTRPSSSAAWQPEVTPRPEPAQSSGLFDYQGGLPRPAAPPHPELADEQRVAAAPSPSAPWSAQASA
jgi:hypothetical protein